MTNTEKMLAEVLQSETHNDDLGIVFTRVGNKYYCSIDWQGGEMKFELGFIHQAVAEERERMVKSLVFRDVEYTSLDRMSQVSRDNYFYNLSLNQVKDDILSSINITKKDI